MSIKTLILTVFTLSSLLTHVSLADDHAHEGHSREEEAMPSKPVRRAPKKRISVAETPPVVAEKKSEFELEKGLMETIYQNSLSETAVSPGQNFSRLVVTPHLSILNPQKLRLVNNYFDVNHVETLRGVPAFSLSASAPLAQAAGFSVSYLGKVGYAFRETFTKVKATSGIDLVDQIKVHWLTFGAGLTADYQISGAPWVRPFLGAAVGMQWLYQGGKLDGLEQGFWIPFYEASAGLTLFSRPRLATEWFGGLNLGASVRRGLSSEQQIENWSMDLGLNLYL